MRQEPEKIAEEGHERIVDRVAAIDVAKASGKVCTRISGEHMYTIRLVENSVIELADTAMWSPSSSRPRSILMIG